MKKIIINTCLLVLSIGWLIPAFYGFAFLDEWVRLDVFPIIYGNIQKQLNSFPSYQAGKELLTFGFLWFAASITSWGVYLAYHNLYRQGR